MRTSKRDRIVAGALELAHRDGFDTLTFDALAEHVGLTRGGVIYHFRTKTDLLERIAAANVRILGVILNNHDFEKAGRYYGEYNTYGETYGQGFYGEGHQG